MQHFYFQFFFLHWQIYKGPDWSFRYSGLQLNCEYRFRVCAIRQCQETAGHQDLIGPYSATVLFISQRTEPPTSTNKDTVEITRTQRTLSDEQCAAVILLLFAVFSILIAFIIQYFVIKWGNNFILERYPLHFTFSYLKIFLFSCFYKNRHLTLALGLYHIFSVTLKCLLGRGSHRY